MFRVNFERPDGTKRSTGWEGDRRVADDLKYVLTQAGWPASIEVQTARGGKPTVAGQGDAAALQRAAELAVRYWNNETTDGVELTHVIGALAKAAGLADPTQPEVPRNPKSAIDLAEEAEETEKVVKMIEGLKVAADGGAAYLVDEFDATSILAMIDSDDCGVYAARMMEAHAAKFDVDDADGQGHLNNEDRV